MAVVQPVADQRQSRHVDQPGRVLPQVDWRLPVSAQCFESTYPIKINSPSARREIVTFELVQGHPEFRWSSRPQDTLEVRR